MFIKFIYFTSLFLLISSFAQSQEKEMIKTDSISINIDSLVTDSIRKEYIQTHIPLSIQEKRSIVLEPGTLLYGKYLGHYIKFARWYAVDEKSSKVYVSRRVHSSREWILYLFLGLIFSLGLIHSTDREYIRNLFRIYFNKGFIFRQTKDQLQQSGLTSFFLNFLFVFSTAVFFFFGTGLSVSAEGWDRWYILGMSTFLVLLIYLVKFAFFNFMAWLFDAGEAFGNYIFIVFLNAKITGLLLLIASMLIAVSEHGEAYFIFKWVGFVLLGMLIFRSIKGYAFFSKEVSLPVYLIGCIAVEILPIFILFKFLSGSYELLFQGLM